MRAQQARAAELALGLRALVFTTPTPASPPRPRPQPQPGYLFCCSEAWSLQENMGPPEPGFSVMFCGVTSSWKPVAGFAIPSRPKYVPSCFPGPLASLPMSWPFTEKPAVG